MAHGVTTGHLLEDLVQFGASWVFALTALQLWPPMGVQILSQATLLLVNWLDWEL